MINYIINKTSYICKSSPIQDNKILYPVPTNSLCNIKQGNKNNKIKRIEYFKENNNTKHSSEITSSSNQNIKINNNSMKGFRRYKSNKNLFKSRDNFIIKNILESNLNNDKNNVKFFHPNTIRNIKVNQKKSIIFNPISKPLLLLKFKYYNIEEEIGIYYDDNGLNIAEKVNSIFKLYLNNFEIEKLGLLITQYINNFIDIKSKNNEIDNFGVVINLQEIINKLRKKKIIAKFNRKHYCYIINNLNEDINEIADDIFKKINKYNQYNHKDLKQEIKLSIIKMMKRSHSEDFQI